MAISSKSSRMGGPANKKKTLAQLSIDVPMQLTIQDQVGKKDEVPNPESQPPKPLTELEIQPSVSVFEIEKEAKDELIKPIPIEAIDTGKLAKKKTGELEVITERSATLSHTRKSNNLNLPKGENETRSGSSYRSDLSDREFEQEESNDWATSKIYEYIYERLKEGKPTILNTDKPEDFEYFNPEKSEMMTA